MMRAVIRVAILAYWAFFALVVGPNGWTINGRPWFDVGLIIYIATFFLLEASLLAREGRLGWSMTAKCLVLAGTFLFSLIYAPAPPLILTWPAILVRVALAAVLTWVIDELATVRWPPHRMAINSA
jgi:hypothetical protein